MAPRAPTAYFLFAGEVRPEVQAEVAASNDGKASVALVGKAIGQRWNALSDDEKQAYKDRAAQMGKELKERHAAEAAEHGETAAGEGEADAEPSGSGAPPLPPFGLPTSLVKKIANIDPDAVRITADGVRALAQTAALFLELLAAKALGHAEQLKRKNFKFADIAAVAKRDRRMGDMGLGELLANDAVFAEVHERAEAEQENGGRRGGKKAAEAAAAAEEGAKRMKPLTAFFSGGAGNAMVQ